MRNAWRMTGHVQERPTLLRENDLPPRWDGNAIEWDGWHGDSAAIRICPDTPPEPCVSCRSTTPPLLNTGRIWVDASHVTAIRQARMMPRHLGTVIYAFRCPDCGADQILDSLSGDGQWWDLDESDYSTDGSWGD